MIPHSSGVDFHLPEPLTAPRVSLNYPFGLLIVAIVMVVLPLVYVGLIVMVALGVAYHAKNHSGLVSVDPSILHLLVYFTPIAAGGVLVLFMIKPLFARLKEDSAERILQRSEEPVLFDFVEGVCGAVGAAFPARIQVNSMINASAGGDVGLVSGNRRGLTLTIGLPLAGGLTTRQFAGVLAHEFGHFSQGAGMRLSQTIRRVNRWFFRVVYERDHWDRELLEACESTWGYVVVIAQSSRLGVWLSRRFLVALMRLGHTVSCFLMRQMEFHADSYEARLVGGGTFASTMRRLRVLEGGTQMALASLSRSWSERRLVDDLPALIVAHAESLPLEVRRCIETRIDGGKTRLLDTHPSDLDRMTRVAVETGVGVIPVDGPATVLFRDFTQLCRSVTVDHYSRFVDERVSDENLVSTAEFLASTAAVRERQEAGARYSQGILTPVRMLFLGLPEDGHATPELALQRLIEARQRFDDAIPSGREACRAFERAHTMRVRALQAERLLATDVKINAKVFDLPSGDLQGVERSRSRALSLEAGARRLLEPLSRARRALDSRRYPFEHAGGAVSLGYVLLPEVPSIRDVGGLFNTTSSFLEAWSGLYLRVMAELGAIAEEVEKAAGLEPPPPQGRG